MRGIALLVPEGLLLMVDRAAVLTWLAKQVPKSRIQHILRVETYALELAEVHQLDRERTAYAALLHDLAKYFHPDRLLQLAQAEGLELDCVFSTNPHLLHAPVGAIVARDVFNVRDPVILDAIAHHTLGTPEMCPISCAVFLADSLEPGRGNSPELKSLRKVSRKSLHQAVWLTCDHTIAQLLKRKKLVHPRMVATRNWAMQQMQ
jgi:predicted HD superfamily hydrolase involved in NAD metabolism